MHYYERHIGDYLKDTAHLSLLEHGIYARLMDVYYTREGGIPEKDAHRLIGARTKDERQSMQDVLTEYFDLENGHYVQARCDREISRFKEKQAKARKSAEARWGQSPPAQQSNANAPKPDANASSRANAPAMRTHSEGNATRAPVPSPIPKPNNQSTAGGGGENLGDTARARPEAPAPQENPSPPGTALGLIPEDWQPPAWIGSRLTRAAIAFRPTSATVVQFVAHHRSKRTYLTQGSWGEEFVSWCVRQQRFEDTRPKVGNGLNAPDAEAARLAFVNGDST